MLISLLLYIGHLYIFFTSHSYFAVTIKPKNIILAILTICITFLILNAPIILNILLELGLVIILLIRKYQYNLLYIPCIDG